MRFNWSQTTMSNFVRVYYPVGFSEFYHENTQNHVEKPVCIFISVGGRDILDPAMPV